MRGQTGQIRGPKKMIFNKGISFTAPWGVAASDMFWEHNVTE